MVSKPVQQRRRDHGIYEHGRPLREAPVGGDHHTGVLVLLGGQVQQPGTTGLSDGYAFVFVNSFPAGLAGLSFW